MPLKYAAFPTLPDADPVADLEAVHKRYVDDLLGTGAGLGGVVDCSAMTTAAAINAAAAAAPPAATIWLGPRPPDAPLIVNETLRIYGRQKWLGLGGRELMTCLEAGPSLPAGAPMMAADGWLGNAGDADEPVIVKGIRLDLDGRTGRHGLVVYNFWSWYDDLMISGADGANIHCLHVTDRASNNTTVSSNSHSENVFSHLRFDETSNGAGHFYAESNNGLSNQDGHLIDSFFAGSDGICIRITRAAGWTIENNHLYGCGDNAIDLSACYATKVIGNYVEDFGMNNVTTGPTGGYYTGINFATILDGKPSICANNTISHPEPATVVANRWTCLGFRAGSGQLAAVVSVNGNAIVLEGAATGNNGEAVRFGEGGDSGRLLTFAYAGNVIYPRGVWESYIFRDAPTCRRQAEPTWTRNYTGVTGTHTLALGGETLQKFTVTGALEVDPPASAAESMDGQPYKLVFLASGATRAITFDASIRTSTGVTRGPYSVPSGEVLIALIEYVADIADYVLTAATISAN